MEAAGAWEILAGRDEVPVGQLARDVFAAMLQAAAQCPSAVEELRKFFDEQSIRTSANPLR